MGCAHTHFNKGKRVFVRLKNGEKFTDRFVKREGRFVVLENLGRVSTSDIDTIGIKKSEQRRGKQTRGETSEA